MPIKPTVAGDEPSAGPPPAKAPSRPRAHRRTHPGPRPTRAPTPPPDVDETLETAEAPPPIPAETVGPEADEEEWVVPWQEQQRDPRAVSVEARVVYLGNHRTKGVYYRGTAAAIVDPDDPARTLWQPSFREGAEFYDFSRVDIRGRPIRERLTSEGRPWSLCRHIGHLIRFSEERGEEGEAVFRILARPEDRRKIEAFARAQREAQRRIQDRGPAVLAAMGLTD